MIGFIFMMIGIVLGSLVGIVFVQLVDSIFLEPFATIIELGFVLILGYILWRGCLQ